MAIEFNHFSPQAFERMVQALSAHIFGPRVVIFGSGPDGGREATYEGTIRLPNSADTWTGYTVLQAKCREQLRNNHEDADWLCEQLRHDLDKFLDEKRSLRKPNNYIIVTNVTLSGVSRRGGRAKVEDVFNEYIKSLHLGAYAIWAADELRSFLETAQDIRRAYTAWLSHLLRLPSVAGHPAYNELLSALTLRAAATSSPLEVDLIEIMSAHLDARPTSLILPSERTALSLPDAIV